MLCWFWVLYGDIIYLHILRNPSANLMAARPGTTFVHRNRPCNLCKKSPQQPAWQIVPAEFSLRAVSIKAETKSMVRSNSFANCMFRLFQLLVVPLFQLLNRFWKSPNSSFGVCSAGTLPSSQHFLEDLKLPCFLMLVSNFASVHIRLPHTLCPPFRALTASASWASMAAEQLRRATKLGWRVI